MINEDMTLTNPAITAMPPSDEISAESSAKREEPTAPLVLGLHRGAIDQTTITTQPPGAVMKEVTAILLDMGLEMQKESAFKYRCVRAKKGSDSGTLGVSQSLEPTFSDDSMLSPLSPDFSPIAQNYPPEYLAFNEGRPTLYGPPSEDSMDEVRFSVELTKLVGLKDTYSLDIRRLKGNLKSYSFIYNTIRMRAELNH